MASPLVDQPTIHDEFNSHSTKTNEKVEEPEEVSVISQNDKAAVSESFMTRYKPFILSGLALLILGWWVSATVLPATRHRW